MEEFVPNFKSLLLSYTRLEYLTLKVPQEKAVEILLEEYKTNECPSPKQIQSFQLRVQAMLLRKKSVFGSSFQKSSETISLDQ
jgi:hypothetical protein